MKVQKAHLTDLKMMNIESVLVGAVRRTCGMVVDTPIVTHSINIDALRSAGGYKEKLVKKERNVVGARRKNVRYEKDLYLRKVDIFLRFPEYEFF